MIRSLVTYFSASGVTAEVAARLAEGVGAELCEIVPETPYSSADLNWMDKNSRSTLEMKDENARPALAKKDIPVGEYDIIFVGFPIWWYREPALIDTFLEAYDFSSKTIVPFFTSGGSPLGEGQGRIATLAKGAKVLPGKRFSGRASDKELKSWIDSLELNS